MTLLSSAEKHLITIQGLDYFVTGLSSIFITVFLFAHSDLRTTILFNLWTFASLLFFFTLSGWSLRKFSSAIHMKIGIGSGAFFYLLLFILRDQTIRYLIPLAIFSGFGSGVYWAAYNFNQYIFSNKDKREQYFGYSSAVVNFLSAISPFLGGLVISMTAHVYGVDRGYAALFFLVFLLLAFMVLFIGKLPGHETLIFSYRDLFTKHRSKSWSLVLCEQALVGLYDVALGIVTGVLFYLILKQEVWIGASQAAGYLAGTVGGILSARQLVKHQQYYWLGAVGLSVSLTVFALLQNPVGLWIFVIVSGFTGPFLNTWISSLWFQTMDTIADNIRNKFHLLLERDLVLGMSRIVSLAFLYFYLASGDQLTLAKTWLYFLPLLPLGIGLLLYLSGLQKKLQSSELK